MDSEYNRKFEEMKQYIPFLESMIQRLESTSTTSKNPRQAQLDKIKSLRDLLLDKKKRMKMENLLKCEQVLVNLYAKVEQRDTLPGIKKVSDLNTVRNKLKTVVAKEKLVEQSTDTLPEIARPSETEVTCTGSKEPALFQRRPHIFSDKASEITPIKTETMSPQKSVPKRGYTRVLKSPEPGSRRWTTEDSLSEKQLFCRRSPRKSPRRFSPTYSKRERRKSSSQSRKNKPKDLNITLNVPEESLKSLNTVDILSRILNCNDNDVDIDTLRDLRTQILGELKQTGANEDISDLIIKSYEKNLAKKDKKQEKEEIEEGELSDSESEAIESIYGSLILVDKDKSTLAETKPSTMKEKQSRKIQISLVINTDKEGISTDKKNVKGGTHPAPVANDQSDFQMFEEKEKTKNSDVKDKEKEKEFVTNKKDSKEEKDIKLNKQDDKNNDSQEVINIDDENKLIKKTDENVKIKEKDSQTFLDKSKQVPFKLNFYKPLHEQETVEINKTENKESGLEANNEKVKNKEREAKASQIENNIKENIDTCDTGVTKENLSHTVKKEKSEEISKSVHDCKTVQSNTISGLEENVEIPLLNLDPIVPTPKENDAVSEIDILRALKNEILSESLPLPDSDADTPALHQPKLTKVANIPDTLCKKRISIEKYKEKTCTKSSVFLKESSISKEDNFKKQSLKLTEKECERFNFPAKLALDDSSDEENDVSVDVDIYGDLAPKSPENDDLNDTQSSCPIIIPVDPVKNTVVASKSDVDMRQLMPILSPPANKVLPLAINDVLSQCSNSKNEQFYKAPLADPRVRRELNKQNAGDSPHGLSMNSEKLVATYPNMTPSRNPNMTPNARITYELTPSQFDNDESTSRKHVYAPTFTAFESREHREKSVTRDISMPRWETNSEIIPEGRRGVRDSVENTDENPSGRWVERGSRATSIQRDNASDHSKLRYNDSIDKYQNNSRKGRYSHDKRDDYTFNRLDCPRTPVNSFGRSDCPMTPTPSFGRLEAPMTPVNYFGRSDCPATPSHSFGRNDAPLTPSHPFGRSECPITPSHPFGRSEVPLTPSHPFGRSEVPLTPSHQFGRSEAPLTPSHQFGRSEPPITSSHQNRGFARSDYSGAKYVKDPRLNRSHDYESSSYGYDDDRDRYYKDRRKSDRTYKGHDSYRNYVRDQNFAGNERSYDNSGRYNREISTDSTYPRDRGRSRVSSDWHYERDSSYKEGDLRGSHQRAPSVGRTMDDSSNRHTSRAISGTKNNFERTNNEKTLSVKPQSGLSFTIDTSVNRTFQEFLTQKGMQVLDSSFDTRRQRASSVGRSLTRENSIGIKFHESSVDRALPNSSRPFDNSGIRDRRNFTRARSIGRDMSEYKHDKSLKDIKAEFKMYCDSSKIEDSKQMKSIEKLSSRDPRNKITGHMQPNKRVYPNTKSQYSPRKNIRDPRLRRDNQNSSHKDRDYRSKNTYGIVYSYDNIAKGAILGSGYGVKNYKIPKIKRVTEDKEETDEKDNLNQKDKEKDKLDNNNKLGDSKVNGNKSVGVKLTETNETKFSKDNNQKESIRTQNKSNPVDNTTNTVNSIDMDVDNIAMKCEHEPLKITKPKINKKRVIYDSDSESDDQTQESTVIDKSKILTEENVIDKHESSEISDVKELGKKHDDLLETTFAMDDIEILPENINALIADLDNDIGDSKNIKINEFTNEISIQNMFDSVEQPTQDKLTMEESIKELSDVIKESDSDCQQKTLKKQNMVQDKSETKVSITDNDKIKDEKQKHHYNVIANEQNDLVENSSVSSNKSVEINDSLSADQKCAADIENVNSDNIVSTTEIDKEALKAAEVDTLKQVKEHATDSKSAPDSTINISVSTQFGDGKKDLPDSTNEVQNDSDITSTHDSTETSGVNVEPSSSIRKDDSSQIGSIGSLLSILQDKSKIKELFCMLGENSAENEKIKKKLEKLSELISDDEDTNDVSGQEEIATKESQEISGNNVEANSVKTDVEIRHVDIDPSKSITDQETVKDINESKDENHITSDEIAKVDTTNFEDAGNYEEEDNTDLETDSSVKINKRQKKYSRKGKKYRGKQKKAITSLKNKRVTRSDAAIARSVKPKASRELKQLQEDIKEMFISEEILNATGIRMCRLAKLVDDKSANQDDIVTQDSKPVVVLEKFKENDIPEDKAPNKLKKKIGPKPKSKVSMTDDFSAVEEEKPKTQPKYKPGPKSKTRVLSHNVSDPYSFESDSVSELSLKKSDTNATSSDSESDSLASSKSFESLETLAELKKKPKRKRRGWQAGVIKSKKRKKVESKSVEASLDDKILSPQRKIDIPDLNCFTDKTYCFLKNVSVYSCRLCDFSGSDIVHHYKMCHPHSEIPLSRMDPNVAREAIEQCDEVNFQAISKISSDKYVCRFCFKEFGKMLNSKGILETFFWHVVSIHTGEYKQPCSECINVTRCPRDLDIPAPPKDIKGQLIGYICGKCNFTQISLENLKTHVIVRHNDEQTEVYTINLAVMTRKTINALMKRSNVEEQPRMLRSSRSNQSRTETSDEKSDVTDSTDRLSEAGSERRKSLLDSVSPVMEPSKINMQKKITFENEDNISETPNIASIKNTTIKIEEHVNDDNLEPDNVYSSDTEAPPGASDDIIDVPHFKISFTDSGAKEYVCCINGNDNHYKTSLLVSMNRHVKTKHPEKWDGYCYVCKLIVTTQGEHLFKECLQHFLDKHIDNFPVMEQTAKTTDDVVSTENVFINSVPEEPKDATIKKPSSLTYINVRPLSELLPKDSNAVVLPKIENVMSISAVPELSAPDQVSLIPPVPTSQQSSESISTTPGQESISFSDTSTSQGNVRVNTPLSIPKMSVIPEKIFKYEEAQAEIMSKKHEAVLHTMLLEKKLVHIFKCAGRFCHFTTDSANDAVVHASTHQRIGGENALVCAYCDFDCSGNYIDLVTHVFKDHGCCSFVCRHCFYRAAASQLVRAHMLRVHGEEAAQVTVLKTSAVTPEVQKSDLLAREVAVHYYICNDVVSGCKYRTYTSGKFLDHLMKHEAPYLCYLCSETCMTPKELIVHMKIHDINLFQCTWCIHGADNEAELLNHASLKHPHKQPQAYLRVISQSKDGSNKMTVLPLAQYNKAVVPTEHIAPYSSIENPIREAERSIDLEKLIASVNISPVFNIKESRASILQTPQPSTSSTIMLETAASEPSGLTTPPISQTQDLSQQITPVLKTEPLDTTPVKAFESNSEVICLDSDEETAKESDLIEASDEDATHAKDLPIEHNFKTVPMSLLYKCPRSSCSSIYKKGTFFKRHLYSCFSPEDTINCGHCTLILDSRDDLIHHYERDHTALSKKKTVQSESKYLCGLCEYSGNSWKTTKNHAKTVHGVAEFVVTSKYIDSDECVYTVRPAPLPKTRPKRKLSAGNTPNTPPKKKRYDPKEVDQIPPKPILDDIVYCALCEFGTKVRCNLVRHLHGHAERQPVPQTAPVNPVPHLETNEKHFDKMVNLASSSIVTRAPDKQTRVDNTPVVNLLIPPEAASRYPKYVPERQRHTCGAKGCSYISVDEAMLKCHWETLHAGSNEYHCAHCPPYQHLDTSKPLTASRIIAHMKMHDIRLYACSSCAYYHYKRQVLEKHLMDVHKGSGQVMVVREEVTISPTAAANLPPVVAPTMDLKAWQCGLCKFKSMLRQEVVEHCYKIHSSKMQYKCSNCPFRTSTLENVNKHKSNSHPGSVEEIIYYYYREGSIPDESDGTPRWMKQRQKMNLDAEVKTEIPDNSIPSTPQTPTLQTLQTPPVVNLNLVKKEVVDPEIEESIEELCKRFGSFCDPNGLKYKCPLCKTVVEDTKDAMQSHLYEELQYRKWSCSICSYKAFHKTGLHEHMLTEHRQNRDPIELPLDARVEKWVSKLLEYQAALIEKTKENFDKQRIQIEKRPVATTPNIQTKSMESINVQSAAELEQAFGRFGEPSDMNFCCPKCNFKIKDHAAMQDHLESELNRIRWRCSNCSENFQEYHEAQFHCKTVHQGRSARPVEALRDTGMRAAWVAAVLRTQKQAMNIPDSPAKTSEATEENVPPTIENPLLVVRYAERVPTPEEEMLVGRKRPAPDSDDERLVIDEPSSASHIEHDKKMKKCAYCEYTTKYATSLHNHLLKHYNLKPYTCRICNYNGYKLGLDKHNESEHPNFPLSYFRTKIPSDPPAGWPKSGKGVTDDEAGPSHDTTKVYCLICEKSMFEIETLSHTHGQLQVNFAKKGDVVVKCCHCLSLFLNIEAVKEHNDTCHPNTKLNYAYFKLQYDTREIHECGHCDKRFKFLRDLKSHHNGVHISLQLKYTSKPFTPGNYESVAGDDYKEGSKRSIDSPQKRVAKKSTTKLPKQSVAKKSTTKLPLVSVTDSEDENDFTYYGTKPASTDSLENVTINMPDCNTVLPLKTLNDYVKINPKVVLKDIKK